LLLEHTRKQLCRFVWLSQGVTTDKLFQQTDVHIFGALSGLRLVKEFEPEADQVGAIDLASLENAIQLQVGLPIDEHVLVFNVKT